METNKEEVHVAVDASNPSNNDGDVEASEDKADQSLVPSKKMTKIEQINPAPLFAAIFATVAGAILVSTIGFVISIALIVMGSVHTDDCPASKSLPWSMIALGGIHILQVILKYFKFCLDKWKSRKCGNDVEQQGENENEKKYEQSWPQRILGYISTAVFIHCSYVTYSIYEPSYNPEAVDYCHKTLYKFAFWYLTIIYAFLILLIVAIIGGLVFCCVLAIKNSDETTDKDTNTKNETKVEVATAD